MTADDTTTTSFKALKLYNNNKKLEKNKTVSNKINEETYHKLKEILLRDRKGVSDWLQESAEEYIIKHGHGNPSYTLDQFNEPNFLATPGYHNKLNSWESYLTKCSDKHYKQWCRRLDEFMNLEHKVTSLR